MRPRWITAGLVVLVSLSAAACGGSSTRSSSTAKPTLPAPRPPVAASSGQTVGVVVDRRPGSTAVFAKVTIKGRPFLFRVDTGATRTVVSQALVRSLMLPRRGAAHGVPTLGCTAQAQPVGISDWRLGDVALPAKTIDSTRTLVIGATLRGVPLGGLLGSDVLARFGSVTFDFAGQRLILGGRAPRGGRAIAMRVGHHSPGGLFETVRAAVDGRSGDFLVDTGSGIPLIESSLTRELGLPAVGRSVTADGATGCQLSLLPVRIDHWAAGGVTLPATVGLSSSTAVLDQLQSGVRPLGLIGAGTLASFGQVTFDFVHRRLVLGGRVP